MRRRFGVDMLLVPGGTRLGWTCCWCLVALGWGWWLSREAIGRGGRRVVLAWLLLVISLC